MTSTARRARQSSRGECPGQLRLNLMGGFSVVVDGERCEVADGCQRLLVFLALREPGQCRTLVAASLWPEKTDHRASANLRSLIWRLPSPHGLPLVTSDGAALELSEHVDVDVRLVESAGWALVEASCSTVDLVDSRLFLLELLPGWYDDWVVFERERLAQLQLHFLEALVQALIQRNRIPQALDAALRLVSADPLREGSQRALLAVYRAERNLGQARRQVEAYRRLINETFGCDPSSSLLDMAGADQPQARSAISNREQPATDDRLDVLRV